jgi:hypothetical protein
MIFRPAVCGDSYLTIFFTSVCFRLGEVDEGMKNAQSLLVKQNTQVRHQKLIPPSCYSFC